VIELWNACCESGHELLLEMIPPRDSQITDAVYTSAMKRFYNLGVKPDWWKLPPQSRANWQAISDIIAERAPHCRGVVMLGLDAPADELKKGFMDSAGFSICKGFAIGRTIFSNPSRKWLGGEYNDEQLISAVVSNYLELVKTWKARNGE
jgi:5-dehydro-2-deoxygluconokinase